MPSVDLLSIASAKVRRRLLPFLILCYFAAYLDRVNIGFAALTMNADLSIGPEAYGFAAGIFFLGYCAFEIPSNVILDKVGARLWIARIMISWGLVSASMAFVTSATGLSIARFFLGVAEAGFFPGIIYYLMHWVPSEDRARVIGVFMTAVPLSSALGAPLSGWILDSFAGIGGFKSWQWLFLIEAIPSIALGIAAFWLLPDRPATARWLTPEESTALTSHISAQVSTRESVKKYQVREALLSPRVLLLSLVYFGIVTGMYGLGFWLPQIIQSFGLSNTATGLVSAIPYVFAAVAMTLWGLSSDRMNERIWHITIPCLVGGAALAFGASLENNTAALAALTLAAIGIFAALPTFWTLPSALLTGTAAAAGIALINTIGNIGGFLGPYIVGFLKQHHMSAQSAVAYLAVFVIAAGLLVLAAGHDARMESARRQS